MSVRVLALWFLIRGSYWFLPTLMAAGAAALSVATVAAVARDLDGAIDVLFPETLGEGPPRGERGPAALPAAFEREARPVPARGSGYVRAIDTDGLMALATEHDLRVRLLYRPGHFVMRGSSVALAWPPHRVDEATSEAIDHVFLLGEQRTLEQDVEFAVSQLVEVALRALSPERLLHGHQVRRSARSRPPPAGGARDPLPRSLRCGGYPESVHGERRLRRTGRCGPRPDPAGRPHERRGGAAAAGDDRHRPGGRPP